MSESQTQLFSFDNIKSVIGGVILISLAWARLEYKSNEQHQELKAMIEKYIVSNDKDKEMLAYQLGELRDQVDVNTITIKAITDFIKPDGPEIKRRRNK